jgi:hypothetical protein
MDYITKLYQTRCENLQEEINRLEKLLEVAMHMPDGIPAGAQYAEVSTDPSQTSKQSEPQSDFWSDVTGLWGHTKVGGYSVLRPFVDVALMRSAVAGKSRAEADAEALKQKNIIDAEKTATGQGETVETSVDRAKESVARRLKGYTPSTAPTVVPEGDTKFVVNPGQEARMGMRSTTGIMQNWGGQHIPFKGMRMFPAVADWASTMGLPPGIAQSAGENVRARIENAGRAEETMAAGELARAKTRTAESGLRLDSLKTTILDADQAISARDLMLKDIAAQNAAAAAGGIPVVMPSQAEQHRIRSDARVAEHMKNNLQPVIKQKETRLQAAQTAETEAEKALKAAGETSAKVSKVAKGVGGVIRWLPGAFGAYDLVKTLGKATGIFGESYIPLQRTKLKKKLTEDNSVWANSKSSVDTSSAIPSGGMVADWLLQKAGTKAGQQALTMTGSQAAQRLALARGLGVSGQAVGWATMPEFEAVNKLLIEPAGGISGIAKSVASKAPALGMLSAIAAPFVFTQSTASDDMIQQTEAEKEEAQKGAAEYTQKLISDRIAQIQQRKDAEKGRLYSLETDRWGPEVSDAPSLPGQPATQPPLSTRKVGEGEIDAPGFNFGQNTREDMLVRIPLKQDTPENRKAAEMEVSSGAPTSTAARDALQKSKVTPNIPRTTTSTRQPQR